MNKIANLIITYNRCGLLKRCLKGVYEQTYMAFDIVVVNNGSTDETSSFLEQEKQAFESQHPDRRFVVLTIEQNNGPCDAFYLGKQYIFENGYDWAWIMDDDGYAAREQLENLLRGAKETKAYYLNALVLDDKINGNLVFALAQYVNGKKDVVRTQEDASKQKYIVDSVNPYNGTFIHRRVYEKCGNMRRSMVIHHIENEYEKRVKMMGLKCITVTDALHYHPLSPNRRKPILKGIINASVFNYASINEKMMMYMVRNGALVEHLYGYDSKWREKSILYFLLHFQFGMLYRWLRYYKLGKKEARKIKKNNEIIVR